MDCIARAHAQGSATDWRPGSGGGGGVCAQMGGMRTIPVNCAHTPSLAQPLVGLSLAPSHSGPEGGFAQIVALCANPSPAAIIPGNCRRPWNQTTLPARFTSARPAPRDRVVGQVWHRPIPWSELDLRRKTTCVPRFRRVWGWHTTPCPTAFPPRPLVLLLFAWSVGAVGDITDRMGRRLRRRASGFSELAPNSRRAQ